MENETTPYMVEPMDMMASRKHSKIAFIGPAQSGKPLWVGTPVPTPNGWSTMGISRLGTRYLHKTGHH